MSRLWVGLGNPGADYADTRHNFGWMALDALAAALPIAGWRNKFDGQLAELSVGGDKLYLFKPQAFMNRSGPPVQQLAAFYKIALADILVFHDELDLKLCHVRLKQGGGAAGHNGLKSLDAAMGPDYWRLRLGIGHPRALQDMQADRIDALLPVADYVLRPFSRDELASVKSLLDALIAERHLLLQADYAKLQTALARHTHKPAPDDAKLNEVKPNRLNDTIDRGL